MLIDTSYFFGNRAIAQISEESVAANVDAFITKYEPKLLRVILGDDLYDAFIEGLIPVAIPDTDPVEYEPIPDRWLKLRDGSPYTDKYGRASIWRGFLNEEKDSPIADYVYFYLLGDTATATTGTGEKITDAAQSRPASVIPKQTRAWNNMVELNKELRSFLQSDDSLFPEWADPFKPPVYKHQKEFFQTINVLNW